MKRIFLFLFASVLSISMFAAGETGKTKGQAIPYDWSTGIHVSSEAGVGKWYVVMLRKEDGGPFNNNGKTDDGKININVSVVNPLDVEADINCTAYIGDNETNRHFKLAAGGIKSMTFGAGAFIKMGIDRVYLYLVMDVTVTEEEAQAHEAVNVNVTPVENENSVVFVPDTFRWNNGWPGKNLGITIPANKETWVMFDFATTHSLQNGHTYKFYIEKNDATPITVDAGVSYDCPASSIQEQSQELKSASTAKVLDEAKLSMIPDTIYVRIKAAQELRIYAEQVAIPAPTGDPIFNINGATEVQLWNENDPTANVYTLDAEHLVYSVDYATLQADENHYRQIEVTNNGPQEVTIVGKASKTYYDHTTPGLVDPDPTKDGNVYSVATKTVTIPAGQTYYKKIDKTMQNIVGSEAGDKIYALGPLFPNVTFKLTQQPVDPEYCKNAQVFVWDEWNQQDGGYKWYSVNIGEAKDKKADIILTMETIGENVEADLTVDLAAACELGEPTQNYSGKSKSTTKTLSYSLYKDNASDEMFVRVRTDKPIKVKAEMLTSKTWNGAAWSDGQAPTLDEAARIEGDLTIHNGETIKALGLTLDSISGIQPKKYATITIKNGGKLVIGKEGIKGSETVDQIIIEEGGVLLIDPACSNNNKPFITAHKGILLGKQKASGAQLNELHDFIALPIEDREAGVGTFMRYSNWVYTEGWRSSDNFRKAFVGYNVFIKADDSQCPEDPELVPVVFKGRLAANKNQKLSMPGEGWHAFGNSWFEPIAVENIYGQLGAGDGDEVAVHKYIATPQEVNSVPFKDNQYAWVTAENYQYMTDEFKVVAPMQGFFLYTPNAKSISLNYSSIYNNAQAAPAPKRAASNDRNNVAVVVRGGNGSDHVFMVETDGSNVHKMLGNGLAMYAEDGLGQVAHSNLIGTTLTIQTNEATEYTLSFAWLNGETLVLQDMETGATIDMTAENTYTFTAAPNTVAERFQVIGRKLPTAIENADAIKGANKVIENGKVVIIKNGVKYNVLGAKL